MRRLDNLEFRYSSTNRVYELVQWEGDTCIVIAFFRKSPDGCNIELIGDRPFKVEDKVLVWAMLKFGQTFVDAEWRLEDELF